MTVLLEAFNEIQHLSAAGPVSSLMVTEYKCSGRQENPDHPQKWEVKINLKSILQAFTSTFKISLLILSLRLFWIAVSKWGQSFRVNDSVAALEKEIIVLVLAVYSQLENISFFSPSQCGYQPESLLCDIYSQYKSIDMFSSCWKLLHLHVRYSNWKEKKKKDHKALGLQIISHSRSGPANFPHQKKKKASSKRQRGRSDFC